MRRNEVSYNSITVCLDNSLDSSRQLEFSLALALRQNAHLTGLHIIYGPRLPYDTYGQSAAIIAEWEETARDKQVRSQKEFRAAAQNAGDNFDWAGYRSSAREDVDTGARA